MARTPVASCAAHCSASLVAHWVVHGTVHGTVHGRVHGMHEMVHRVCITVYCSGEARCDVPRLQPYAPTLQPL